MGCTTAPSNAPTTHPNKSTVRKALAACDGDWQVAYDYFNGEKQ